MIVIILLVLIGWLVIAASNFFSPRTSIIIGSICAVVSIGMLIAYIVMVNIDIRAYTPYKKEIVSEFYTANEIIMKDSILPVNEDGSVISNDIGANHISLIEIKDNEDSESLDKIVITKVSGKFGWLTSEWYEAVIYK
jgi:hypothetical protein